MVRKLATQVPQAVTRLLRAQTITPPVWYKPVANHPPSPLPARQIIERKSPHDLPASLSESGPTDHAKTRKMKHAKTPKLKIQPIVYEQKDLIRKRFFEDFPFEALRPTSLVEGRVVNQGQMIEGAAWTELRQRGENPTVENAIEYVINLHEHHGYSLAAAYRKGTNDFVSLRAVNEMAQFAAEQEAVYYGATWTKSAFERFFELEEKALDSLSTKSASQVTAASTSRPIRPTFAPTLYKRRQWVPQVSLDRTAAKNGKEFTGGLAYVTAWADVEKAEKATLAKVDSEKLGSVAGGQAGQSASLLADDAAQRPVSTEQVQQEVPVSSQ
ncbi:hypothetical protein QFC22_000995 [Naganishia vaughanmartiniae]|uniref:Uncharacterized protein n=1 Tax=Naganishia vaughanmartiniae TaxID=1424756 RepID=A0ACC2XK11_9TREE|nr:hypothetical protein QFC22_000995 [Naganishia vaughanmartiniae]